MKKKVISLTHGMTAIITVSDPSNPLGWSAVIHGVSSSDKNIMLNISGEDIWRYICHLIEEAEYHEREYSYDVLRKILEKHIPKEYIKLAKELKKKEWESYEDRGGAYPILPGTTVSMNSSYKPPVISFRGTFPGQFFEIRLPHLVEIIKAAMELLDVKLSRKEE